MKTRKYLFHVLLAFWLSLGTTAWAQTTPIAMVSGHCSTGLDSVHLETGTYTTRQLSNRFVRNNDISWLKVNAGYEMVLFDGDDFTGDSVALQGDFDCLTAIGWNDRVSSLKIQAVEAASARQIRNSSTKANPRAEIYPSPVVDKLYLSSAVSLVGNEYRIFNWWGKSLASGPLPEGPLDVAALPPGLYTLIVLVKDGQTITRRFVK